MIESGISSQSISKPFRRSLITAFVLIGIFNIIVGIFGLTPFGYALAYNSSFVEHLFRVAPWLILFELITYIVGLGFYETKHYRLSSIATTIAIILIFLAIII